VSQSDDIDAINAYFNATVANTPAAAKIKADFLDQYANLGWFDKNTSSSVYDSIRSQKNAFNIANAVTEADKAKVTQVLTSGLTTEEMGGQARPNIDLVTGKVTQAKAPPAPGAAKHATIRQGSKGADVIAWQNVLSMKPDGVFGPALVSATKTFQKAHGLTVDGVVGPMTWSAAIGKPVAEAPVDKLSPTGATAAINTPRGVTFTPTPSAPKPNIATGGVPVTAAQLAANSAAGKTSAAVTAAKTKIQSVEAGIMGGSSLPLWSKILIGIGVIGSGAAAVHHSQQGIAHDQRKSKKKKNRRAA